MNIIKQLTSGSKSRPQAPGAKPGYMEEPERSGASARISSQPLIAISMAPGAGGGYNGLVASSMPSAASLTPDNSAAVLNRVSGRGLLHPPCCAPACADDRRRGRYRRQVICTFCTASLQAQP
jgi:hypothetical protein